ncbi:uncharacterized protein LOC6552643 [Drosophila erecta]|uniref:GG17420 n=1 Tax=Drosophila erecta TaxID=7220 RepID=B3P4S3_DROER|nr:uncharacterized protein LOC6552643 [Drosophila erecta]EDV49867.1 uncharacterized protein Dere_GG17420 [Drosophila erecta]
MIGEFEDADIFHDCRSDDEETPELDVGGGDEVICKQAPRFDDPVQIRAVLERAATATQRLLRCYGGTDCVPTRPLMTRFYPATLEVSARLHTDDKCPCPKDRQCKLMGDPVTLKLPIELNPESGQVKVNIFQPKSIGTFCGCNAPANQNKAKSRRSSVKWSNKDEVCRDGQKPNQSS